MIEAVNSLGLTLIIVNRVQVVAIRYVPFLKIQKQPYVPMVEKAVRHGKGLLAILSYCDVPKWFATKVQVRC